MKAAVEAIGLRRVQETNAFVTVTWLEEAPTDSFYFASYEEYKDAEERTA